MYQSDVFKYDTEGTPEFAYAGWTILGADITHNSGRVHGVELTAPSDRNVYIVDWGGLPGDGGDYVALSPRDATLFSHDAATQSERISEFGGITSTSVIQTGTVATSALPEGADYDRGWFRDYTGTASVQQPAPTPGLFFYVPAGKKFPFFTTSVNAGKSAFIHWVEVVIPSGNMRY